LIAVVFVTIRDFSDTTVVQGVPSMMTVTLATAVHHHRCRTGLTQRTGRITPDLGLMITWYVRCLCWVVISFFRPSNYWSVMSFVRTVSIHGLIWARCYWAGLYLAIGRGG
jgi:hypothetical protein